MRLLLDTHIWLWSLSNQPRLTPQVRRALAKPGNELWLSPVSTWEVAWLVEQAEQDEKRAKRESADGDLR